jgi:dipeptidyl aminopeptidase/acylaminoacyl peptidase
MRLDGVNRWLLGTFLCGAILSVASAQRVSFPGTLSEAKSPDGRYIVRNTDDEKREPSHVLTLIATENGSATKIYSYGRHVEVLWSPTSRALVVNDYEGSDAAHPVLFTAPWTDRPVDLRENLIDFLRLRGKAKSSEQNHHVYFSAQRWLSGNEILCEVSGYGDVDPKGFAKRYIYKLGAGFRPYR